MILSNLKSVATLQYKPEGPHMLFYMTTTKANLVWEQEHTHVRQAQIASQLNNLASLTSHTL